MPEPVAERRAAIRAWLAWRGALQAARAGAGEDALRAMLRAWWTQEGLPKLERLSASQANLVLDKIVELDWNGRPF